MDKGSTPSFTYLYSVTHLPFFGLNPTFILSKPYLYAVLNYPCDEGSMNNLPTENTTLKTKVVQWMMFGS